MSSWWDETAEDWTTPSGMARGSRLFTRLIYVHRCSVQHVKGAPPPIDSVPWFFTEDPEGVATVTLPGSYRSKIETIQKWRKHGIPQVAKDRAFAPYHAAIADTGRLAEYLRLDRIGAHAGGRLEVNGIARRVNAVSISLALLGDFRSHDELTAHERSLGRGRDEVSPEMEETLGKALRSLMLRYPLARVVTHTQGNAVTGVQSNKKCPGAHAMAPLARAQAWALEGIPAQDLHN